MTFPQLTSRDNPLLKTIRKFSSGSAKPSEPWIAVEGVRVLEEACQSAWETEAVVISENFGMVSREQDLIHAWQLRSIRIYQVKEALFKSVSSVQTPQGAIALVRVPELSLSRTKLRPDALILCAFGLQDPGNLGTLIRTAAAAGASMVCTTAGTVSARNPKTIRSSAGAFFRIPVIEHIEADELRDYCAMHHIRLFRTDARNGIAYTQADLRSPCAILLGNEGSGLTGDAFAGFPSLHIPMAEDSESLNVAIAGAIILFEAFRQRH